MPATRRVLAAASAIATLAAGASAANAAAATIAVPLGCVVFAGDYSTKVVPIVGTGFTPSFGGLSNFVTLRTVTAAKPTPAFLASVQTDASGSFATAAGAALFNSIKTRDQTFTLIATESANPGITAATTFRQVRAGYTREPDPTRPRQRVRHVARGFVAGGTVYAHFRHGGRTRTTKSLGQATGPCGIATKRMRALPARPRLGDWTVFVDQSKRFSKTTRPQARLTFTVFQRFV